MLEHQFEPVVTEKMRISKGIFISVSFVVVALVSVFGYKYYKDHTQVPAEEVITPVISDEVRSVIEASREVYKENQKRLQAISLPELANTDDSDAVAYQEATSELPPELRDGVNEDTVYNSFVIEGDSFGNFLDRQPNRSTYDQFFTGLHTFVNNLGQVAKRPALRARLTDVEVVGTQSADSVYPSIRVADGYLVAAIATAIDPDTAAMNERIADAYARRGMMYGWYGQSDIDATKALMKEYLGIVNIKEDILNANERASVY